MLIVKVNWEFCLITKKLDYALLLRKENVEDQVANANMLTVRDNWKEFPPNSAIVEIMIETLSKGEHKDKKIGTGIIKDKHIILHQCRTILTHLIIRIQVTYILTK